MTATGNGAGFRNGSGCPTTGIVNFSTNLQAGNESAPGTV